mgnify:CR=1 FL=1
MVKVSFLKKLFNLEPKEVTIPDIELQDWLEEYSKEKFEKENNKIENYLTKFVDEISKTLDNLEKLKDEELMNKKIPPREIHLMRGNRKTYIEKTKLFLIYLNKYKHLL